MANGKILKEYKRKLDAGDTVPQNITNAILLTAMIEIYEQLDGIKSVVDRLNGKIEIDGDKTVTWPWIKDNILVPILRTAITLGAGYVFLKITGVAP